MNNYGFEVYSSDGVRLLDDKSFSVVGYKVSLPAGKYTRSVSSNFVFVGVKGSEIVGKRFSAFFYGSRRDVITIDSSHTIEVIFYEYEYGSPSQDPNSMGITVSNEQGDVTFDSRNLHLVIESSVTLTPSGMSGVPPQSFPLDLSKIYILHSQSLHMVGVFPIGGGGLYGMLLGVKALYSPNSSLIQTSSIEIGRYPYEQGESMLPYVPYVGVLTVAHT